MLPWIALGISYSCRLSEPLSNRAANIGQATVESVSAWVRDDELRTSKSRRYRWIC